MILQKGFVVFLSWSFLLSSIPSDARRNKKGSSRRSALGKAMRKSSSQQSSVDNQNKLPEGAVGAALPTNGSETAVMDPKMAGKIVMDGDVKDDLSKLSKGQMDLSKSQDAIESSQKGIMKSQNKILEQQGSMQKKLDEAVDASKKAMTLADIMMRKEEENKKKELDTKRKEIMKAKQDLSGKIEKARSECSGISGSLDTIFGLTTATTVASGTGTLLAGGALAVGLIKDRKDKTVAGGVDGVNDKYGKINKDLSEKQNKSAELRQKINQANVDIEEPDEIHTIGNRIALNTATAEEIEKYDKWHAEHSKDKKKERDFKRYSGMLDRADSILDKKKAKNDSILQDPSAFIEKAGKDSKTLGHVRTGLLAGATVTSATSMGTSIGASVTATQVAEKMKSCNQAVGDVKIAKNLLSALIDDFSEVVDRSEINVANNIISACPGFNSESIITIKNTMVASSVVSGIGTATAATGTVTSVLANTNKFKENGKAGKLNLTSNIMAGITAGTSLTTTALSGSVLAKIKKERDIAADCERGL